jgi:hypothetical protein
LDSSVGIATAGFRFTAEKYFSLSHSVQTDPGAHPGSYPMGTGGKDGRGVKLTVHLYVVSRQKVVELYLHSPMS